MGKSRRREKIREKNVIAIKLKVCWPYVSLRNGKTVEMIQTLP